MQGSIKKHIYNRVKEHLGFGSVSTEALNLKFWIPETIYLRIHLIPVENADLTCDIEAAVAINLNL